MPIFTKTYSEWITTTTTTTATAKKGRKSVANHNNNNNWTLHVLGKFVVEAKKS
jgi:hypothetical protein